MVRLRFYQVKYLVNQNSRKFGGVVPEIAARAHLENIDFIINKCLQRSKIKLDDVDGIAATAGPGLIVCLNVGLSVGKTISAFKKKPFIAVNHLEGSRLKSIPRKRLNFLIYFY